MSYATKSTSGDSDSEFPQQLHQSTTEEDMGFRSSEPGKSVKYSWDLSSSEEDEDSSEDGDHHRQSTLISEIFEKFPESIRKQLNLEELLTLLRERKARRHSKAKVKIITTSRGGNGPLEELSKKLERFKIRTIIVEDTDKQEEGVKL